LSLASSAADGLWVATGHEGAGAHGPTTGRQTVLFSR
jgi:hypothetical protein